MKNTYNISWISEYAEFRIEIDIGFGYVIVADNYIISKTWLYTTDAISITVKVTPYIASVLTPSAAKTYIYTIPNTPTNLVVTGEIDDTIVINWDTVIDATEYRVLLKYVDGDKIDKIISTLTTTITIAELISAGGPWPEFVIYVYAINGTQQSLPAKLYLKANIPIKTDNLLIQSRQDNGVILSWDETNNSTGYKVYQGLTIDFDPVIDGTLMYDGELNWSLIDQLNMTEDYQYYFKVVAYNHYYKSISDLNFSDVVIVIPTEGTTIFCKTFDDADVSGVSEISRLTNSFGSYFYFKVYPTISVSNNGTTDDIGYDLIGISEADISDTPKLAEFRSNGIDYYFKISPTISIETVSSTGATLSPVCFTDTKLFGTPRVARITINGNYRYFKVYPTKE